MNLSLPQTHPAPRLADFYWLPHAASSGQVGPRENEDRGDILRGWEYVNVCVSLVTAPRICMCWFRE